MTSSHSNQNVSISISLNNYIYDTSSFYFAYLLTHTPMITSISPDNGSVGDILTIIGTLLNKTNSKTYKTNIKFKYLFEITIYLIKTLKLLLLLVRLNVI